MPRVSVQSARTRRELQSIRDSEARNIRNFMFGVASFENAMHSLQQVNCIICKRKKFNVEMSPRSTHCKSCGGNDRRLFTADNGMDIGEIPIALKGLTLLEQVLIARVHPVISVFKIRGQQTGYRGHVINFSQHVSSFATNLPVSLGPNNPIILMKRETIDGIAYFRVRREKVLNALTWLKENNPYYRGIAIDRAVIESLPLDGDVSENLPSIELSGSESEQIQVYDDSEPNTINASCFPNISPLDQAEIINEELNRAFHSRSSSSIDDLDAMSWPSLSSQAANEFNREGVICCAFPALFPYGRGDLRAPREFEISYRKYFQYLMEYHDGRFAMDIRFPYYAYNSMSRWDALSCGNVYVHMNSMQDMTNEDFFRMIQDRDIDLSAMIMYYGSNLRATRSYWKQRCSELLEMVKQLGAPTIFFTLTAADYHWNDLFRLLNPGIDPNTLTEGQRRKLMHANPSIVSKFFKIRCTEFMKSFMSKIFDISDFWYRYEWQHRGSPHIHGMLWLNGAPSCNDICSMTDAQKQTRIDYFEKLVFAWIDTQHDITPANNPCRQRYTDLSPEETTEDLDRLLSTVQRHTRCSGSCLKKIRGSSRFECRYKFPFANQNVSSLIYEDGHWRFYPKRNDPLLQRYNPLITQGWRGNSDFSAIISLEAVVNYIAKYASKGEQPSAAYSEILRNICSSNMPETSARSIVQQLLNTSIAERNFSAQEVHHLIMGWDLYHASRTFIVLSLNNRWRRIDGSNENHESRYARRDYEFIAESLFSFVQRYRFRGQQVVRRRKDVIVRVIPYLKLTNDPDEIEEYYKQQSRLHIPWICNFENQLQDGRTWQEFYVDNHIHIVRCAQGIVGDLPEPDDIQYDQESDDEDGGIVIRDPGMVASRLRPSVQHNDPLGRRPIDQAYEWPQIWSSGLNTHQINLFLSECSNEPVSYARQSNLIDINRMSDEQRRVIAIFENQLSDIYTGNKRTLIQGRAGTGKSAIINYICIWLDEAFPNKVYEVLAPTGVAAVNVNGRTIHSSLHIPVNGELLPLNGEVLRTFQLRFSGIKFIIIDEYSMLGLRMLGKIHTRLCEASGRSSEPFGGYFIYFFGDLRQLPPVKDCAMYSTSPGPEADRGRSLLQTIQNKIVLKGIHRQDPNDCNFIRALDNLSIGNVTNDDWRLLMSRRSAITPDEEDSFSSSLHLYATNVKVEEYNLMKISEYRRPVALIEAEHNNSAAKQGKKELAQNLNRRLYLSEGTRVMLRKNINVAKKLVNGSLGTVREIIYADGHCPPSLPLVLLIEFDNYPGPFIKDRLFPVTPISVNWKNYGVDCSRRQFPIDIAYAMTIHKSQGLTIEKATIDIGPKEAAIGLSYVGLSRVRSLKDMRFERGFDLSRLASIRTMKQVVERERFMLNFFGVNS